MNNWHKSVKEAIKRMLSNTGKMTFTRQMLISEEIENIKRETKSEGRTPEQTLSRVLQELRDESFIYFLERGEYLLTDSPVAVSKHELSEADIDGLIEKERFAFDNVETADPIVLSRRRMGQQRIRTLSLKYYDNMCALCDVRDERLLVASHITRWSDDPEARGRLCNVICLCRFHDPLFEMGYIALADDYTVLKSKNARCRSIQVNLDTAVRFRMPSNHPPSKQYLSEHRRRTGLLGNDIVGEVKE